MRLSLFLLFVSAAGIVLGQDCGGATCNISSEICWEETCRSNNDLINCTSFSGYETDNDVLDYCEAESEVCELNYNAFNKTCKSTADLCNDTDAEICAPFVEGRHRVTYNFLPQVNESVTGQVWKPDTVYEGFLLKPAI